MKNFFYFTFTLLSFFSCKTENKEIKDTLCENQKILLAPLNLPTFEFDLNNNPVLHTYILKDSLKNDLSKKINYFNWKFNDRIIKIDIIPQNLISCGLSRHQITIDLNFKNSMLFEGELINPDSLSLKFSKEFNNNKYKNYLVNIDWPYGLDKSIINNVIISISEGYLMALDRISIKNNNKSVCELNKIEVEKLLNENPISINLLPFLEQIEIDLRWKKMIEEIQLPE